jgi:hypothetical protein
VFGAGFFLQERLLAGATIYPLNRCEPWRFRLLNCRAGGGSWPDPYHGPGQAKAWHRRPPAQNASQQHLSGLQRDLGLTCNQGSLVRAEQSVLLNTVLTVEEGSTGQPCGGGAGRC